MYYLNFSDGDFVTEEPIEVMMMLLGDYLNWYSILHLDDEIYKTNDAAIARLFKSLNRLNQWEDLSELDARSATQILT